jgi:hypothetical protein
VIRRIELVRAAWGAALLVTPRQVLGRVHHLRVDRASVRVARVLGARQLGQALLSGVDPSPEVLAMGVWVDGVHAATAVGLAVVDRHRARAGLTDAAIAGAYAVLGYRDLVTARATPPSHQQRRRDELARAVLGLVPGGGPLLSRCADARTRAAGSRTRPRR